MCGSTGASTAARCAGEKTSTGGRISIPKLGLGVVMAGALVSAVFYWFGLDLVAYGILAAAALIDLFVYRAPVRGHGLLPLPRGIPRRVPTHGARLRSPHGRRAGA